MPRAGALASRQAKRQQCAVQAPGEKQGSVRAQNHTCGELSSVLCAVDAGTRSTFVSGQNHLSGLQPTSRSWRGAIVTPPRARGVVFPSTRKQQELCSLSPSAPAADSRCYILLLEAGAARRRARSVPLWSRSAGGGGAGERQRRSRIASRHARPEQQQQHCGCSTHGPKPPSAPLESVAAARAAASAVPGATYVSPSAGDTTSSSAVNRVVSIGAEQRLTRHLCPHPAGHSTFFSNQLRKWCTWPPWPQPWHQACSPRTGSSHTAHTGRALSMPPMFTVVDRALALRSSSSSELLTIEHAETNWRSRWSCST
eukprot:scaffold12640_cov106-Isochrysis_galbana.AAC.1